MLDTHLLEREKGVRALEHTNQFDGLLVLVAQRSAVVDDPGPEDLHTVGTLAKVVQFSSPVRRHYQSPHRRRSACSSTASETVTRISRPAITRCRSARWARSASSSLMDSVAGSSATTWADPTVA
jgi:ATP-dependent Lon protease